jgi:alpha-tubulin suppressor-like RCC1 family protein
MAAFELKPYANVAAGGAHSLVCAGPKKIMSFGNGRYGQLGTGRTIQFDNPYQVDKGEENSDRIMWDDVEHSVVHVVCGNNHSAALTDKGRLYMWGRNNKDQLGIPKPLDAAQAKNTWMPCLVDITHNHTTCSILHVTCGVNFTAAVDMDANVFTWGLGTFGNLGHGDTRDRATPTFVEALEGKSIVMLAAGAKHVLAVTRFGDLYSWGHSGNGRLGLEDEAEGGAEEEGHIGHLHPRRVHGIRKGTRYVVAGEAHSVAVSHEGRLYTWGAGSYGRLGHGFDTDESVPKIVENLHDQIKMAACGVFHTVVLTKSGRVWVFGGGQYGQLGLGDDTSNRSLPEELQQRVHAFGGYDVLQVASGDFHCICLAVSRDLGGAPVVMTWGFGAFGRLGQGRDKLGICTTPHKVEGLSVNVGGALRAGDGGASAPESAAQSRELLILQMYTQTIVQQISCGAQHSGAVTKNGRLYMWGCNDFGQIGDGECPRATLTPTESSVRKKLLNSFVTHLACGHEHTLALTYEKQLFAWGRGSEYQLGISHNDEKNPVPVLVQALFGVDVIDVQAGEAHSAAILETGALYTWGAGDLGKLGHGRDIDGRLPRRVKGELLAHRVRKCSLGMNHTVALTDHGEIFTWGAGWFGRLGTGATNNEYEPKRVRGVLEGRTATAVAAGAYHTLAICDGDLYVWGRNEKRLGIGDSPSELLLPKRNEMLRALGEDISGCAAGEEHSIVFTKLGSVYSWGTGVYCKLGHVNRSHVRAPQKDEVGADDQAESSGKLHEAASLQMDADAPGAVMLIPETEDGVSTKKLLLEEWDGEGFPSRSDVRAVATYSNHCIALTLSGHVYVWGCAGSGRLGVELREKQGGIQPQAVRVMCDEWKDESVSVSGHHGRGGAAGDGHSATKVHSLSDRDGGGGGGGAGDVEIGVRTMSCELFMFHLICITHNSNEILGDVGGSNKVQEG